MTNHRERTLRNQLARTTMQGVRRAAQEGARNTLGRSRSVTARRIPA